MQTIPNDPACFANHMGPWLMEPGWLRQALAHIQGGTWTAAAPDEGDPSEGSVMVGDGIAVVSLAGPMMKGRSKFGGTSTVQVRRQLREAASDDSVRSVLLHIDSPGGHVAGTADLADDIRAVDNIKPVHAHIDDLGASAALWAASQARRITANRTADIGSMGVLGILVDESEKLAAEGVKVHVLTTGWKKAIGYDPEVTQEQIGVAMDRIGDVFAQFRGDVARGRGTRLTRDALESLSDGGIVGAKEAKRIGLIDGVGTMDAAIGGLQGSRKRRTRTARARIALARLRGPVG